MNAFSLHGQCAVVSGGLGDIGRSIARELASAGVDIAVGDCLPSDVAESLRTEIERQGRRFLYHRLDICDAQAVHDWLTAVEKALGAPTLIIPNAAIATPKGYADLNAEAWRRELDVNLNGAFYLAHQATRRLVELEKEGRVVFIGSWAAHAPHRKLPAYSVAKAGLRMLCKTMALELAKHGILVNEIAPGYVNAGLSGRLFERDPALAERSRKAVPTGRLIEPGEVARQVLYFCGPDAAHLTGTVQIMDGGLSLLMGPQH